MAKYVKSRRIDMKKLTKKITPIDNRVSLYVDEPSLKVFTCESCGENFEATDEQYSEWGRRCHECATREDGDIYKIR